MVNLISIPSNYSDDAKYVEKVTKFFHDYSHDWYRLTEKKVVSKFKNYDLLFPVIYSRINGFFYYETPFRIN